MEKGESTTLGISGSHDLPENNIILPPYNLLKLLLF
jgi:hypothetical protein